LFSAIPTSSIPKELNKDGNLKTFKQLMSASIQMNSISTMFKTKKF